jgi:hypothetical protein
MDKTAMEKKYDALVKSVREAFKDQSETAEKMVALCTDILLEDNNAKARFFKLRLHMLQFHITQCWNLRPGALYDPNIKEGMEPYRMLFMHQAKEIFAYRFTMAEIATHAGHPDDAQYARENIALFTEYLNTGGDWATHFLKTWKEYLSKKIK